VYDARIRSELARCLADAFLAGEWELPGLLERAGQVLDRRPRWARQIARDVLSAYPRRPADRRRELARFVAQMLDRLPPARLDPPRVRRRLVPQPAMGRAPWPVPELAAVGDLADFLGLELGQLAWLADARGLERSVDDERLRNYRYRTLPRRGGVVRVTERPKPRLKAIQRRLLHEVLDWIPAHPAAHGFVRGRSASSHARAHVGRRIVVSVDLEDFFASVPAARVFGIFRTAGYPEGVSHALTALTTNVVPARFWHELPRPPEPWLVAVHHRLGRRLATPHLPQGAPTSPALANLATRRLDVRLAGLAASLQLTYTRYADDLTFSGDGLAPRGTTALVRTIEAIARDEGFAVNPYKSSVATQGGRQRVCGIVVNERANVARTDYDRLRAILHNTAIHGAAGQNRAGVEDFRAHLLGRIAWIGSLHPQRGERLRRQFGQIEWPAGP
jgi:hypothetical protein